MLKNYIKIAWRNLGKNKVYSAINIVGLAVGMAVAVLISLWIKDEVFFNKDFQNYDRIVKVIHNSFDGKDISTTTTAPIPLALELRENYADAFTRVALTKYGGSHIFAIDDKKLSRNGLYAEPEFAEILSLQMVQGSLQGLRDPSSIMISQSMAKSIFGDQDPINKMLKVDNKDYVKVSGVYEDFAHNTDFKEVEFLLSWSYLTSTTSWIRDSYNYWDDNSFLIYAQVAENKDITEVSTKVKSVLVDKPGRFDKPEVILQPMSRWHLYSEFKQGINTGGAIQYVWMFGLIGLFVLLLACINFMNLSTARSQKRAKEVGIRKTLGSAREQLIVQFLSESVLITGLALVLSVFLVWLFLPSFNNLANKDIQFPWTNLEFWTIIIGFVIITGLISGSYPALYLSSFNPISVLKGTFKAGRFAASSRKVLVVFQFTVSVFLIIGTIIIFQQIQYAKNRPVGYDRVGLISIHMNTPDLYGKYDVLRNELINSGAAVNMAESVSPATEVYLRSMTFDWPGKNPDIDPGFNASWVTHDYGKTVGWQFVNGRDFSRDFSTDTNAMVINEAAARYMDLEDPLNTIIKFHGGSFHIIGVIKDVVMESPFAEIIPTIFMMNYDNVGVITIKADSEMSMSESLAKIETIFKKYNPASPFVYSFVDDDYAKKFDAEQRIGSLATFFAVFAVFISCLGIFGLSSFMAEQRFKEIGVRKVLGATVLNLLGLLSKEFILLVFFATLIAMPASWYFMHNWLQTYEYRTGISLWVFVSTTIGAIAITLLTVSFQAVKAATANPVDSLRDE